MSRRTLQFVHFAAVFVRFCSIAYQYLNDFWHRWMLYAMIHVCIRSESIHRWYCKSLNGNFQLIFMANQNAVVRIYQNKKIQKNEIRRATRPFVCYWTANWVEWQRYGVVLNERPLSSSLWELSISFVRSNQKRSVLIIIYTMYAYALEDNSFIHNRSLTQWQRPTHDRSSNILLLNCLISDHWPHTDDLSTINQLSTTLIGSICHCDAIGSLPYPHNSK